MSRQGRPLSEIQVRRIIALLNSTDMSIGDIAARMGCSRSAIVQINRHHAVRDYAGNRSRWTISEPELAGVPE